MSQQNTGRQDGEVVTTSTALGVALGARGVTSKSATGPGVRITLTILEAISKVYPDR